MSCMHGVSLVAKSILVVEKKPECTLTNELFLLPAFSAATIAADNNINDDSD